MVNDITNFKCNSEIENKAYVDNLWLRHHFARNMLQTDMELCFPSLSLWNLVFWGFVCDQSHNIEDRTASYGPCNGDVINSQTIKIYVQSHWNSAFWGSCCWWLILVNSYQNWWHDHHICMKASIWSIMFEINWYLLWQTSTRQPIAFLMITILLRWSQSNKCNKCWLEDILFSCNF